MTTYANTKRAEIMNYRVSENVTPVVGEDDIKAKRLVALDAAASKDHSIVYPANLDSSILGVTLCGADVDGRVDVQHGDIVEVEAEAAIAQGAKVTLGVGGDGRVITGPGVGIALTAAAAAGDIITMKITDLN